MAYFIRTVILTICIALSYGISCNSRTSCRLCTALTLWPSHCRWCPKSNTCHAPGANSTNPCSSAEDITDPNSCSDPINDTFQAALAYNYAQLSAVSYSDDPETCIGRLFPYENFHIVHKIGKKCNQLKILNYKECFAFTAVSKTSNTIALAFRGTGGGKQQLCDEIRSITQPMKPFMIGGKAQDYFYKVFYELYKCVKASVKRLVSTYPEYNVTVTGHSLGGALASLAAAALVHENVVPADKMALYTFGSPRVGDKDYADAHSKLITTNWRLVLYKDIVPHLPPLTGSSDSPFHHGVEVFYPRKPMYINSSYLTCTGESDDCSNGLFTSFTTFLCSKFPSEYFTSHRPYYIPISIYCDSEILTNSRPGDNERAGFWSQFNEETCTRVEASGHNTAKTSTAVSTHKFWNYTIVVLLMATHIRSY